jgi:hypothetical protein
VVLQSSHLAFFRVILGSINSSPGTFSIVFPYPDLALVGLAALVDLSSFFFGLASAFQVGLSNTSSVGTQVLNRWYQSIHNAQTRNRPCPSLS